MGYTLKTIRVQIVSEHKKAPVRRSRDLYDVARPLFAMEDVDREHIFLMTFDSGLRPCGFKRLATGTTAQALCDIRLACRDVLLLGATAVAFVHNHPSGEISPSAEDRRLTARLRTAFDTIGVQLIDSIIMFDTTDGGGYYSFADAGELGGEPVSAPEISR